MSHEFETVHLDAIIEPLAADDRVAARLGELLAARYLLLLGALSPRLLGGLVGWVRRLWHPLADPAARAILEHQASRLGGAAVYAALDARQGPDSIDWDEVDAALVIASSRAAAHRTAARWLAAIAGGAPVMALVPAAGVARGAGGPGDGIHLLACPDPGRAILHLGRQPPRATRRAGRPAADVSVIIPTRDRVQLLSGAVRSALEQDPPPCEVLVADDGSRQDVAAALHPFGKRVRLLPLPRRNMAAAMNAALEVARGTHVAWLDDDDLFLPGKLGLQLPLLDDPAVGLCATAHYIGDAAGSVRGVRYLPEFREHQVLRLLLRGSVFLGPTVIVRREAYATIVDAGGADTGGADAGAGGASAGPYDPTLERAADYAVWLRLARRWRFAALQVPLTIVRRHPGNPLDDARARQIFRSVQKSLRWLHRSVPLAEIFAPAAGEDAGPWRGPALLERARACLRAGLAAEARADLQAARQAGAEPERVACLLGLIALEAGDPETAIAAFDEALAAGGPGAADLEALNGLGSAQLLAGRAPLAIATFERAVRTAPQDPLARYNLGISRTTAPGGGEAGELRALARELLARQGHRSALYSPDPPLLGIDRCFANFRRGGLAGDAAPTGPASG